MAPYWATNLRVAQRQQRENQSQMQVKQPKRPARSMKTILILSAMFSIGPGNA